MVLDSGHGRRAHRPDVAARVPFGLSLVVAAVLAFVALCLTPTGSATIALFKGRCFPEPRLPSGSTAEHVGQFRTRLSSVKFGREVSITPFYKFDRTERVKLYPA